MALSVSPAARHQLTNACTAFSLGMLCLIRRWYDLENLQPRGLDYFRSEPPDPTLLFSTLVTASLLGLVFWAAWFWLERHSTPGRRKFAYCVFLLILVFPIESVRRYWNTQTDQFDIGSNAALLIVELLLAAGCIGVLRGSMRILVPARRVALLLMLFFPALMIDFAVDRINAEPLSAYAARPSLAPLPPRAGKSTRLIWLVFDELDQRVVFERRPVGLELPALDRLRGESVVGSHATQTAMFTAIALPSILSGQVFSTAQALNASTLNVVPQGSAKAIPWREESNAFLRARTLGVNAALVGWHHPYCRILGDELTNCFAIPSSHSSAALADEARAKREGLWPTVIELLHVEFLNLKDMLHSSGEPDSEHFKDAEVQQDQQQQYFQIRDHAYAYAANPNIGMLFVHFPAPHPYPIYNRRDGNFNLNGSLDYFDNVALVDRTVGELRALLESAGMWDQTAILITADHGLRPGAWIGHVGWSEELDRLTGRETPSRVPFILKLPGETTAAAIDTSFSNSLCGDLGLEVLAGAVATPAQAVNWLTRHSAAEQFGKPNPGSAHLGKSAASPGD